MKVLDQFIQQQAQPHLIPGEQIIGTACLLRPIKVNMIGVAAGGYDPWLVAMTYQRFLLFHTRLDGIALLYRAPPQALNLGFVEIPYDTLESVTDEKIPGLGDFRAMKLRFFEHLEPRGLPMYAESDDNLVARADPLNKRTLRFDMRPSYDQLEGQAAIYTQFPEWLAAQVKAGAFPMSPERQAQRAAAIAEGERQAAEKAAARAAADAAAREAWRQRRPALIRGALVYIPAAGVLVLAYFALLFVDLYERELVYGRQSAADEDLMIIVACSLGAVVCLALTIWLRRRVQVWFPPAGPPVTTR